MRRPQQPKLPGIGKDPTSEFGGSLLRGNARNQRPIAIRQPMHMILRSSFAHGSHSFLLPKRSRRIRALVNRLGERLGVKVYRLSINGNHLHFILQPRSRQAFGHYVRAVAGVIARLTMGWERGRGSKESFWDARPFTRFVKWGKDFRRAKTYVLQNTLEAFGMIPFVPRKRRYPSTA